MIIWREVTFSVTMDFSKMCSNSPLGILLCYERFFLADVGETLA